MSICKGMGNGAVGSFERVFHDEDGFTTTSMVLSLLITLSLVFTAAQVYRVSSASAEVQDVADASALAAENQVAEFMIVARYCDAIVLSLSLTGLVACGLGIAALCTPVTATLSEKLLEAGKNLIKARDAFSNRASTVLNKMQEALPFFAAACAANVAQANNADSTGSFYIGAAMLVPSKGEEIGSAGASKSTELVEQIDEEADEVRENADKAEEASERANRSKERAFMRDCGDNPDYCMYERAASLADLSGSSNPLYTNVDAWSFSVALERAKKYYRARLRNEEPEDSSYREQARSALRTRYYRYAVSELDDAYVHETENSFEANFPHLPSNTSEMRFTSLYTDEVYPITYDEDDVPTMHAWGGCPDAEGYSEVGSIEEMEEGDFDTCDTCEFRASSLGKVAAASTSVPNGFEYHYEAVADEAFLYEEDRRIADGYKDDVKDQAGSLFEKLIEAAKEAANKRIVAVPPGRYGAVAFVVNAGETSAAMGFPNAFVASAGSLGPRAAISAATLVDEGSDEGKTVLNSALDGLSVDGGIMGSAASFILDAWSWLIVAYSNGQQALTDAIRNGLDAIPLASESGLGTWAADKLNGLIEDVGLQPAEVGALKPVLVNSAHVVSKGDDAFSRRLLQVKGQVVSHPLYSTDLFSSLLSDAERIALEEIDEMGGYIEIASIELLGEGGPSIPITIPLPPALRDLGRGFVQEAIGRIRSFYIETTGVRVWE